MGYEWLPKVAMIYNAWLIICHMHVDWLLMTKVLIFFELHVEFGSSCISLGSVENSIDVKLGPNKIEVKERGLGLLDQIDPFSHQYSI